MRPVIWSFGGGTQSVAIGVLVHQGRLPMPERIVMADTGREATETWEYLERVVRPWLGLNVEIASHDLATVDLYARGGKTLLPMYTRPEGRFPAYCSNEWKKRVIRRWMGARGYGPNKPVRLWLGISVDEIHRAKPSGSDWIENHWPLLADVPLRRDECRALVHEAGLPDPPRSSCWMCPHRGNAQWKRLRDEFPGDWGAALKLEREIRQRDPNTFLHHQRVPLDRAELGDEQEELFPDCDGGYCFV